MTNQNKVLIIIGIIIAIFIGYAMMQGDTKEAVTGTEGSEMMDEEMSEEHNEMDDVEMMDDDAAMMKDDTEVMEDKDEMVKEESDEMIKEDEPMIDVELETATEAEVSVSTPGEYLAYNPEAVASSNADSIILSFSATWCPSCRTLDKNINENLSSIPSGVEIYKVDYDSNVALRQQYGVTTQHTMVEVDQQGNLIQKWSGGNTLNSIVARI